MQLPRRAGGSRCPLLLKNLGWNAFADERSRLALRICGRHCRRSSDGVDKIQSCEQESPEQSRKKQNTRNRSSCDCVGDNRAQSLCLYTSRDLNHWHWRFFTIHAFLTDNWCISDTKSEGKNCKKWYFLFEILNSEMADLFDSTESIWVLKWNPRKKRHESESVNLCLCKIVWRDRFSQSARSGSIMQTETWESPAYRCPVCMQIYSDGLGCDMTPLVICMNLHTLCRGCATRLNDQHVDSRKCPECRTSVWKEEVVNREKVYFLEKSLMVCGSCEDATKMTCVMAREHSRECVENHITCPLLNNDAHLSTCTHGMNISALWDHCQKSHMPEGSPPTMHITAKKTDNQSMTASFSVSLNFETNNYFFFTVATEKRAYNMCLHLTRQVNATIQRSEMEQSHSSVVFCLRRFFTELELDFRSVLLSVSSAADANAIQPLPQNVKMTISIQMYFTEKQS